MEQRKCLGIWLDHSRAHLIELENGKTILETVLSEYSRQEREDGKGATGSHFGENNSTNNEYSKHQRQQEILYNYYRVLSDRIKHYNHVVLFGPTKAKEELYNKITSDNQFSDVALDVVPTDKMTENQMNAFVKDHFKNSLK